MPTTKPLARELDFSKQVDLAVEGSACPHVQSQIVIAPKSTALALSMSADPWLISTANGVSRLKIRRSLNIYCRSHTDKPLTDTMMKISHPIICRVKKGLPRLTSMLGEC